MIRRTKIVATLGPSSEEKGSIASLVDAGMNIARLNFSHGTYEQFQNIVKNIRAVEAESGQLITIMQDLQGPKIRLGTIPAGSMVKRGETVRFSTKKNDKDCYHIPYSNLPKVVKPGQALLIEDGLIRTKIVSIKGSIITVKIQSGGELKSHKGVNIPDSELPASASLTTKDRRDLEFGIKTLKVDAVAVSFVENAEDILRVRKAISKWRKSHVNIIAKIERKEALKNLESIIDAADGVMVARGDLGIETRAERVPVEQKRIIALARKVGKPVIIATQILQSMVDNPLPTRAEMSDAANAIFDHADAFMLSNETAVGKYPIKAVQTLARVAHVTEQAIFADKELFPTPFTGEMDHLEDESIALNACMVAEEIDAQALIVLTKEGYTARTVIKHRPKTPMIVITNSTRLAHELNFMWGITQIVVEKGRLRSEESKALLKKKGLLKKGDDCVLIKLSDKKRSLVVMEV